MKKTILFMIIAAMTLAACGGQQFVCADGTVVDDPTQCNAQQEQPDEEPEAPLENTEAPAPEEKEQAEDSNVEKIAKSAKAQELVDVVDEKVNSFSFVYVGPPENLPTDKYFVRGNRILVELQPDTNFKQTQPYSHVYIDTERKTATAYCLAENRNWCPNGRERYGRVDFDKYMVRTPYQWLTSLQTAEVLGSGQQWENQATDRVDFTTEDQSGEMLVVSFYGIPGKVKLDNGDTIEFRYLTINNVPAEKVAPPTDV